MKLSIIIVSWNVKGLLKKCLESIKEDFEIIVVDNNSKDGTKEMVEKDFPEAKLIKNKKNLGFAKANNQGIQEAKGDCILFLNPDTEILDGTLEKCLKEMDTGIGILGCKILNPDLTIQPSVRRFPTFLNILLILSKLPKFFHFKSLDHYLAKDFNYDKSQEVDQVMGAFMMVKKEVLDKVGMFDERFFLWFEEVDFCRRAKRNGFKIYYLAEAEIIHYGGQSFGQEMKLKNQWRFFLSALKYFLK
ncbi:MAG: glycosyltransferase family 2 protein [Patescibacteria group bacterium]